MMTTLVKVLALKDFEVNVNGEIFDFKKGKEYEVPKYVCLITQDLKVLGVRISDLRNYIFEEREEKLSEIPKNFYDLAEVTYISEEDYIDFRKAFTELLEMRIEKISRLATSDVDLDLPHEEKVLYEKLHHVIDEWRRDVVKRVFGD